MFICFVSQDRNLYQTAVTYGTQGTPLEQETLQQVPELKCLRQFSLHAAHSSPSPAPGPSCGDARNFGGQEVVRNTNDIGSKVASACDCQAACKYQPPANTWYCVHCICTSSADLLVVSMAQLYDCLWPEHQAALIRCMIVVF